MLNTVTNFFRWLMLSRDESREPRFAAHRYARQRRLGFPFMRFFVELEREYRESFFTINVTRIRFAHTVGILSIFGFIVMDRVVGLSLQPLSAIMILLLICTPALAAPLVATFNRHLHVHLHRFVYTGTLIMGLGMIAVIYVGRLANNWFPYEAMLLVTVHIYYVSGLQWRQAMSCGWILWLCFALVDSFGYGRPAPWLAYEIYYVMIANLIGMVGRYIFEYQDRIAFLMQHELRYLAQHDSLTNLLNRRAFRHQAEQIWNRAIREKHSVGVLLIDLDHFKQINDEHGHLIGDAALLATASSLSGFARQYPDCAGRFGGDEFVAIWYGVDPQWFEQMLLALHARISSHAIEVDAATVRLQLSGGAVIAWPDASRSFNECLQVADANLYEMKRSVASRILCTQQPALQ